MFFKDSNFKIWRFESKFGELAGREGGAVNSQTNNLKHFLAFTRRGMGVVLRIRRTTGPKIDTLQQGSATMQQRNGAKNCNTATLQQCSRNATVARIQIEFNMSENIIPTNDKEDTKHFEEDWH